MRCRCQGFVHWAVILIMTRKIISVLFLLLCQPRAGLAYQFGRDPKELLQNAGDILLEAKIQSDQVQELRKEISSLIARVDAGGQTSRCFLALAFHLIWYWAWCRDALIRLTKMASQFAAWCVKLDCMGSGWGQMRKTYVFVFLIYYVYPSSHHQSGFEGFRCRFSRLRYLRELNNCI